MKNHKHIQLFSGSVRMLLPTLFKKYKGIILIISLGAVVRMIAPILKDKKTDPAVVVIDDRGENVISVLSGHLGGANQLTHEVARPKCPALLLLLLMYKKRFQLICLDHDLDGSGIQR